jgi:hypothetical protein
MYLKKALPSLCFFSGLGLTCNIDSALDYFSGSLLMLLACIIWIKRADQQQHRPAKNTHKINPIS